MYTTADSTRSPVIYIIYSGVIANTPALVQVMAWYRLGNQPLPGVLMTMICKGIIEVGVSITI